MYEYIKGTYIGINKDYIVIENNKIGYRIFTSGTTIAEVPEQGKEITLYTEQIVREDFIGLYGFLTKEELEMFKILITVNGVGPKAALSLLSISSLSSLKYAIMTGDEKLICKGVGIGKKTAARIILELKDKIELEEIIPEEENRSTDVNQQTAETLSALLALGYTEKEAEKAVKQADKNDTVENMIKNCLKILMG